MKLLLLTSAYHPYKGGVEEVVRQLARACNDKGHQVLVVAPRWPRSLPQSETVDGQLVLRLPMPLPSRHARSLASFLLWFPGAVMRTLYIGWRWRPDVVHVQCVGPNGLYALVLSWLLRTPLVVTSQGEQTMDATKVYERSAVQRWILRRLLRRAGAVTACSADALHNLAPYGPITAPTSVIPNGVDPAEFLQPAPASPHTRPYVLAIGRHVWNKGFDVLLRAYATLAARYPDVDLVVAGDGPEHDGLVTLARELGIADRVVFPGRTDRAMTATLFHHAQLFVLPSLHEPFGIVNLEAMTAGKAVIATRAGGVPEIVHEGQNGLLVPPGDATALAGAIETLLRDPTHAEALGQVGARLVREQYTWERVASSYLKLYDQVLSRRTTTGDVRAADASVRRDLLCIGQEDWDEIWRRNQFLLAGLAHAGETRRILFVERPCDVTHGLRTRGLLRSGSEQQAKLARALEGPRRGADAPGLWLLTPFKLLPNSLPASRRVNEWLERTQVSRALHKLGMRQDVLWTQNPGAAHWLAHSGAALTVYDATDDWSAMDGPAGWVEVVRRGQEALAYRADVVLACSQALFDKWSRLNAHTHLVPNGVDVAHFARVGQAPLPADVAHITGPVLGYTGTLHDERVDVELIYRVASERPDWRLVFVGPDYLSAPSRTRLAALPNVHLLGPRSYEELPAYMGLFDVCIIPHRVTPFTESLNPIKIYEYLATGLPIVSTPVATVRDLPDVVYLARDAAQFVARAADALAERDEDRRAKRRRLAEQNSWQRRVDAVILALNGRFADTSTVSSATPTLMEEVTSA